MAGIVFSPVTKPYANLCFPRRTFGRIRGSQLLPFNQLSKFSDFAQYSPSSAKKFREFAMRASGESISRPPLGFPDEETIEHVLDADVRPRARKLGALVALDKVDGYLVKIKYCFTSSVASEDACLAVAGLIEFHIRDILPTSAVLYILADATRDFGLEINADHIEKVLHDLRSLPGISLEVADIEGSIVTLKIGRALYTKALGKEIEWKLQSKIPRIISVNFVVD